MQTMTNRGQYLNQKPLKKGPVIYWMNRDMRIEDNWALLYAQSLAISQGQPFAIIFSLFEQFETAHDTTNDPMFKRMKIGLKKVKQDAQLFQLPFYILHGPTVSTIHSFLNTIEAGALITDFTPLKAMRALRTSLAQRLEVAMIEVDAHNVIPCHVASQKQEWGAYTLRPKIHRLLPEYLIPYPMIMKTQPFLYQGVHDESFLDSIKENMDPQQALNDFIHHRLSKYEHRNDPMVEATSRLSSYLHFGHLSSQTIALRVNATGTAHEAFLEELIVRKELADNFCFYNAEYDSVKGFPEWARKTLDLHRQDVRQYQYTYEEFATGKTHDEAWNAAQLQMVKTGYMHGYMRMYWAKKILEWTPSPDIALAFANQLNDTFELDGRDPNGYTGTAWAIGGVHDRPWQERPIFGMIRYMNAAGLKRKFDIGAYIRQWLNA